MTSRELRRTSHHDCWRRNGTWIKECAFLSRTTADRKGYILTNEHTGVTTNIYCSYDVNYTRLPYTMTTAFRCEHDLVLADIAARVGFEPPSRPPPNHLRTYSERVS